MSDANESSATNDIVAEAFDNLVRTMKQAAFDGDDSMFRRVGPFVEATGHLRRDWQAGGSVVSLSMPKGPKKSGTPGRRGRRSNAEIAAANAAAMSAEVEGADIDASSASADEVSEAADLQAAGAPVTSKRGRVNV